MITESKWLLLLFLVVAVISAPAIGKKPNSKDSKVNGALVFAQHCAKCHTGGGNVLKDSHPIVGSKQLANLVTFKTFLSSPPGHMPYYQDVVGNKKKLDSLYEFCKNMKAPPPKQASLLQNLSCN